jgi:DNA-binding transcriptional MerR regulator
MKYLTTLEVAREIGVSKQTLLNWLYARKVPEPPRTKRGHRLWSASRVLQIRKLIGDGLVAFAREVGQFLREAQVDPPAFLRELARQSQTLAPFIRQRARGQRTRRKGGAQPREGEKRG